MFHNQYFLCQPLIGKLVMRCIVICLQVFQTILLVGFINLFLSVLQQTFCLKKTVGNLSVACW